MDKLNFGMKNMDNLQFELSPMDKQEFRQLAHENFKDEYPQAVDKVTLE
jgi:hypothetical protein